MRVLLFVPLGIGDGFESKPQDVLETGLVSELSAGLATRHRSFVLDPIRY